MRGVPAQHLPVVVLDDLSDGGPGHGVLVHALRVEVVQRRGRVRVSVTSGEVERNLSTGSGLVMFTSLLIDLLFNER